MHEAASTLVHSTPTFIMKTPLKYVTTLTTVLALYCVVLIIIQISIINILFILL